MSERTNDGDTKAAIDQLRQHHEYFPGRPLDAGCLAAIDKLTTTVSEQEAELERYRADLYQLAGWPNDDAAQMREFARRERAALTQDSPEEGR